MKSKKVIKNFDDFSPQDYLNEYFTRFDNEIVNLYEFFIKARKIIGHQKIMIELGGGPTIYQLLHLAPLVDEIHFSDYVDANIQEVKKWHENKTDAFDWTSFTKLALEMEKGKQVSKKQVLERENILRSKITKYIHCDALKKRPLGKHNRMYNIVDSTFVAEGITNSKVKWNNAIGNILSLVKPGGFLILNSVTGADYWKSGQSKYVAASVTETDIMKALQTRNAQILYQSSIEAVVTDRFSKKYEGYQGMSFIIAQKA